MMTRWLGAVVSVAWIVASGGAGGAETPGDAAALAARMLRSAGVDGGFVIHLGCGDGRLTAALRLDERYTVHGLDRSAANVAKARARLQALGLYGPVSVERFAGDRLPYAENLINAAIVEDAELVPWREVIRVLAPRGVAWVRRGSDWERVTKPWPAGMDEWSHFLHDATNNAVADDVFVGPPRRMQWVAPPLWLRSHETPSGVQSPVIAGGRLVYILDEGLIGIIDPRIPDRWSLVCRDAFNGRLLWKKPLKAWGWREWSYERWANADWLTQRSARTDVPSQNQRRVVADAERVYATLSYRAPLSILDAATGDVLATVAGTADTHEILLSDGVVVAYTQASPRGQSSRRGEAERAEAALVAVDAAAGRVLWRTACPEIRPLMWAIEGGRVVYQSGKSLAAVSLQDGSPLWRSELSGPAPQTLVLADGAIVLSGGNRLAAHDAADGRLLWSREVPAVRGAESADLFVIDGVVWRGITNVDESGKPVGKSPHALDIGWDLRTGQQRKRILVRNLRSPEHHHRCYRNKATCRFLISSFEGAEFLDLVDQEHGQNNFVRGNCQYGMTPANGMLYAPPDQCFCEPGAKLLGYAALAPDPAAPLPPTPDALRLEKGPAYGRQIQAEPITPEDWPTFRHDPARHGAVATQVGERVRVAWRRRLGGPLTAPVAVGDRVYVAATDAHTVYALDAADGRERWRFVAGGRIDSPPTIHQGLVLFGCADGRVYCLRASDGQLVWRFLAAPTDRRVGAVDQLESAWPVSGSVLVHNGVAYVAAGRSTYLDGGVRLYGLDPATGRILHRGRLEGPYPKVPESRDMGFFLLGANADVLVSEGGFIYMRQKKLTPQLEEIQVPVLSSKGAQDVGLHVFSTSGLLDGSWYNRAFWMYAKRWPGFQLANQAPKSGQILVVDDNTTYALRVFYRRNVHSPFFFPGREGYLLFADWNTTEPQIVGEPGARPPLRWLPQSDFSRARGDEIRTLESEAFGQDKMIGYTRADPPVWMSWLPVRIRALVKAGDLLFGAGPPDVLDPDDPYAAFEGRKGAVLVAVSAVDGTVRFQTTLDSPPRFDGLIAARGRLFASLTDGSLACLAPQ